MSPVPIQWGESQRAEIALHTAGQYPYVSPISWEQGEPVRYRVALGPSIQPLIVQAGTWTQALEKAKAQLARIPLDTALRDYERAHRAWMDAPRHREDSEMIRQTLVEARERYLTEYKKAHPTHIVM